MVRKTSCYLDDACITADIRRQAKGLKDKMALIADPFSLLVKTNCDFAKMFDETAHNNIQACLIPVCKEYTASQVKLAKDNIQATFEDLHYGWEKEFFKSYTHIELDVPDKIHFFRRLSNIAFYRGIADKESVARFEATAHNRFENKSSLNDL